MMDFILAGMALIICQYIWIFIGKQFLYNYMRHEEEIHHNYDDIKIQYHSMNPLRITYFVRLVRANGTRLSNSMRSIPNQPIGSIIEVYYHMSYLFNMTFRRLYYRARYKNEYMIVDGTQNWWYETSVVDDLEDRIKYINDNGGKGKYYIFGLRSLRKYNDLDVTRPPAIYLYTNDEGATTYKLYAGHNLDQKIN